MPEIAIAPAPALPHPPLGRAGGALRLSALPEGHVLQVLADPHAPDVTDRLAALGDGGAQAVRALAPHQWLVVGDAPLALADFAARRAALGGTAALLDQSHGRVRLSVSGPAARHLLAKGTAVDLAERSFPPGSSAQTLYGHIGVHLTRTGEASFELIVLRGFAQSLWDELAHLGAAHFGA